MLSEFRYFCFTPTLLLSIWQAAGGGNRVRCAGGPRGAARALLPAVRCARASRDTQARLPQQPVQTRRDVHGPPGMRCSFVRVHNI